jgi:hypothetical protein
MSLGYYLSAYSPAAGLRKLYDPDGNVVATPGTLTMGVNEGIALAIANGFAFKCVPGGGNVVLDTYLTVPPCANADIDLGATSFFVSPTCNGPGFYINSFNGGRFKHDGMLVYQGSGTSAIYMAPATPDPVFGQQIIQNARMEFGWVTVVNVNIGQCCVIDPSQGSIMNNERISFDCLQGYDGTNRVAQCIYVLTAGGTGNIGVNENHFVVGQAFGFTDVAIQVGTGQPNDLYIGDNNWQTELNSQGNVNAMVRTNASYDRWWGGMTIYTGTCPNSIVFANTANFNKYDLRQDTSSGGVFNNGLSNSAIL